MSACERVSAAHTIDSAWSLSLGARICPHSKYCGRVPARTASVVCVCVRAVWPGVKVHLVHVFPAARCSPNENVFVLCVPPLPI